MRRLLIQLLHQQTWREIPIPYKMGCEFLPKHEPAVLPSEAIHLQHCIASRCPLAFLSLDCCVKLESAPNPPSRSINSPYEDDENHENFKHSASGLSDADDAMSAPVSVHWAIICTDCLVLLTTLGLLGFVCWTAAMHDREIDEYYSRIQAILTTLR